MAIKMHEPIGHQVWGPFLVRVSLGGYFVLAGLAKIHNISAFVSEVQATHMLPAPFSTLYAITLPYLEVGAGALMVIGIWTTLAAILMSLMIGSFIFALGLFPNHDKLFNKDIILLCASLSLLYSGAGAFSIDRFRKGS